MFRDDVIRSVYVSLDEPCDVVVCREDLRQKFAEEYRRLTGEEVDPSSLAHRLMNLRRRGQEKGGLPRLRHGYYGRGESRN